MDALISVIIPVYKVERYLNRCVESIAAQSYRNLEIILVDDGSPDQCGDMCDSWARKDARIRVIHKKNGGLSDARNAGIGAANGEYIVFVDSDDYIAQEMIERLYGAVRSNQTKLALCNVLCVDEDGLPTGESDGSPIREECLTAEQILPRFYQAGGPLYIVAWNKLYHRSLLSKETFPVGKWHEDEFIAAQLFWKAGRVACIDYMGYHYVMRRAGSIMSAQEDVRHLDALEALLIRYRFYQEIGQNELLHETRARVLKALEDYYSGDSGGDSGYDARMEQIRQGYNSLTGLPMKEWLKWKVFQVSPRLERKLLRLFKPKMV